MRDAEMVGVPLRERDLAVIVLSAVVKGDRGRYFMDFRRIVERCNGIHPATA